jgi:hypothetical protein
MEDNKKIIPDADAAVTATEGRDGVENNSADAASKSGDRIEWLGIDGLLVGIFAALVIVMFCSLYYKIDILNGYVFPFMLLAFVCAVTIAYLVTLGGFIRKQKQIIRENEAQDDAAKGKNADGDGGVPEE